MSLQCTTTDKVIYASSARTESEKVFTSQPTEIDMLAMSHTGQRVVKVAWRTGKEMKRGTCVVIS